jgi:CspA family cold shock protein
MATGKIKKIVAGKPFGFIDVGGPDDLFFHQSELQGVTLAELHEGDSVEFEVTTKDDGRKSATGVKKV